MTEARQKRRPGAGGVALDMADHQTIQDYLCAQRWLEPGETVEGVEPAGPGNMNLVLRVTTPQRSLIAKQGRPFVEKYPHIAAPIGRTAVEADWYALAARRPALAARLPRLVGSDPASQVLVLSDLGPGADFTGVYAGRRIDDGQLDALVSWLAALHQSFRDDAAARRIENRDMRRLNHEHIFEVPLAARNGLDLDAITPGLSKLAAVFRRDRRLRAATEALGAAYLGPGSTLVHGDFYPGSWLEGRGGPYVIDPEFGFFGPPELDIGVLLAHLELSGHSTSQVRRALDAYLAEATAETALVWAFCGVEVIRRLLGVAQLPLEAGIGTKERLLDAAAARVRAFG